MNEPRYCEVVIAQFVYGPLLCRAKAVKQVKVPDWDGCESTFYVCAKHTTNLERGEQHEH